MRAYSTDLREKIIMAHESGAGTPGETPLTFEVDGAPSLVCFASFVKATA
jgi:hypothetical protein